MKAKTEIRDLGYYFLPLVLFWIASAILLWQKGYQGSFIFLNAQFHSAFSDRLSWYFTHLADGILLPLVIFLFMWRSDKPLVLTGLVLILGTGAITQILKQGFFPEMHRPTDLLKDVPGLHFLMANPPLTHSFPSGHATSFAAGGIAFAWFWRKRSRWVQLCVGLFTVLLCYSRVHLGVHFLGDIFAGSFIGAVCGAGIFYWVYPRFSNWFSGRNLSKLEELEYYLIAIVAVFAVLRFTQMAFF